MTIGPHWVELFGGPYCGVMFHMVSGATLTVVHGWRQPDRELIENLPEQWQLLEPGVMLLEGPAGDAMYLQEAESRWRYEPPGALIW